MSLVTNGGSNQMYPQIFNIFCYFLKKLDNKKNYFTNAIFLLRIEIENEVNSNKICYCKRTPLLYLIK